jgi:hypothetical protein
MATGFNMNAILAALRQLAKQFGQAIHSALVKLDGHTGSLLFDEEPGGAVAPGGYGEVGRLSFKADTHHLSASTLLNLSPQTLQR